MFQIASQLRFVHRIMDIHRWYALNLVLQSVKGMAAGLLRICAGHYGQRWEITSQLCVMNETNVKCLNPWDPNGIRQYEITGVFGTLTASSNGGQNRQGICYAIEGNVVDRVSNKNGKGWCENVSPTLNTQDRHAICIALEGNGARPSHMGKGFSEDGTMYTLNTIEQHSVCYGISRSALKGGVGSTGGMPIEEDLQPTITATGCGAVAYAIENHAMDCRVTLSDDGIVQTLNARMGTGGGNVPLVLMEERHD